MKMTKKTLTRIKKELKEAIENEKRWGQKLGDTAGQGCDWHDNAAYDQALENYHLSSRLVNDLKELLKNPKIVEKELRTDEIRFGNRVVFELNGNKVEFTILGGEDSMTDKTWIAESTPIAQKLLGMKAGEEKDNLKVLEIKQSDYD